MRKEIVFRYLVIEVELEASVLQVSNDVPSGNRSSGPAHVARYSSAKTSQASLWHP